MERNQLKQEVEKLLNTGKKLSVKWDCGGDESILAFSIDEAPIKEYDDFWISLDIHIQETLILPSAGEFLMQGGGDIYFADNKVVITYESDFGSFGTGLTNEQVIEMMKAEGMSDEEIKQLFDEEGIEEANEEYSGSRELFE